MSGPMMTRGMMVVAAGLVLGGLLLAAPADPRGVEDLPPARETLREVGRRLGRTRKPEDLTAIAGRGERVLGELTVAERFALGRGALRFRVDRAVVVAVAVPRGPAPFWLADQGFRREATVHDAAGTALDLFERRYDAGAVGLGVNSLDRSAPDHYAVFVRAESPGSGPPRVAAIGPDPIVVRPAGRDVSPFRDEDRPIVDLPAAPAAGLVIATRRADRADGALLPFGRAWKTRQPSGPRPDQVVASFGPDPARSLAVSWRTDPATAGTAARFAIDPQGDAETDPAAAAPEPGSAATMRFTGAAEPIESDGLLNDPVILRHKVTATDLRPDTRYLYAVGDGSPGGWSRWFRTRTAPVAPRDFAFLYLGDAQCELERWGELAHAAVRACPEAGFLLLAGDLVDRGNERANWDHFFLRGAGVFDAIPFQPAVGNHEYLDKGPKIYRRTFDLARNGPPGIAPNLVYSFEYADAFVAVLDSNLAIYDEQAAASQARWLDEALSRTRATWKFVSFHHPIYASHPSRANPQLGRAWVPVFDRHRVDLVLTGHDHAYLRTVPLRAGVATDDPARGTTYVVAVSGEKFYGQEPHPTTARGLTQTATYQTIRIDASRRRLEYRSYARDGREVDALTIRKPAEAATGAIEAAAD